MQINWDLIPRSRAKNSYDLLRDVIEAIRADERIIEMSNFVSPVEGSGDKFPRLKREDPACGTRGCIAGWCSLLKANHRAEMPGKDLYRSLLYQLSYRASGVFHGHSAVVFAKILMPKSLTESEYDEEHDTYGSSPWDQLTLNEPDAEEEYQYRWPDGDLSQSEYAAAVIANIEKFMQRYERELRNNPIE